VEASSERLIEDLTRRGPAASAEALRLADHLARQISDVQARIRAADDLQRSQESRLANMMNASQEALLEAVAAESTKADTSRGALTGADLINNVLADATRDAERLNRDWRGAVANLQNDLQAIEARLAPDKLDGIRTVLENSPLADLVNDEAAFERIAAAAREGQEKRASMDAVALAESVKAAAARIKGQLLEEAIRPAAEAEAREWSAKLGRQVEYYEGHRIRDEHNRKATDGVLAWRDQNNVLNIVRIYEAKAGEAAARGLNEEIRKLTDLERMEADKYAQDLAIERYVEKNRSNLRNEDVANLRFTEAAGPVKEALQQHYKEIIQELESRQARAELGQKQKTIERMDESRIYVDGKATNVAALGLSRMKAVLPEDVAVRREADALRILIRAADLKKLSEQILDRLRRDGVFS
jgi:hypothetical protein